MGTTRGLRGRRALLALCVGLPVAEFVLVAAFGVWTAAPLAPQTAALAPLEVFHDLRFAMVFHDSWWTFGAMMAAIVVGRGALTPFMIHLAWPDDVPWPGARRAFLGGLAYTALALVLLTPAATLMFLDAIVPLWWLFASAFGLALVPILLLHGVAHPVRWWRRPPSPRALAWLVLTGVMLTLAGLAVAESPPWVGVLPVAAAGVFDAWSWMAAADGVARARGTAPRAPGVRPVSLRIPAVAIGGAVVVAALGFGIAIWSNRPGLDLRAVHREALRGRPVLVALGFRSRLTPGQAGALRLGGGLRFRPFSYRGLGRDGRPLPYGPRATYHSLEASARLMDRQVRALRRESGHEVALVGESEGTLVVKYYLLTHPHAPVDEAILLSPILEPARVAYPGAGDGGFGVATRFAIQRVGDMITALLFRVDADLPLLRSVVRNAALMRGGMGCAAPGVRQEAFLPLVDALAEPRPLHARIPVAVLPAMHGSVMGPGRIRDAVLVRLAGGRVPRFPRWEVTADVIRGSAAAWQVPTLPIGLIARPGAGGDGCAR